MKPNDIRALLSRHGLNYDHLSMTDIGLVDRLCGNVFEMRRKLMGVSNSYLGANT